MSKRNREVTAYFPLQARTAQSTVEGLQLKQVIIIPMLHLNLALVILNQTLV